MKKLLIWIFIALMAGTGFAQTDLQKLVETEKAFAAMAAEKGIKQAFLANMSGDAVIFQPDKVNGIQYWTARGESKGSLVWTPNYADVSSNGIIGYTTGNWEFRNDPKDAAPAAYGEFITVWQKGADGQYRFNVDIGVGHDKPAMYSTDLAAPAYPASANEKNSSAADTANRFFEIAAQSGTAKAYQTYAAGQVRSFREGAFPMIGKDKLVSFIRKAKAKTVMAKRTVFFGSADIAYVTNTYTQTKPDNTVEHGNFMQIWKLIDGRWQIVLDIFKPITEK
ncbi:MAG TPA: hypothetical protein VK468_08730 [Pyrinomonadaceae bacterium]|nr:hypothetical protein [Pyrinomonadaceae bacterium]